MTDGMRRSAVAGLALTLAACGGSTATTGDDGGAGDDASVPQRDGGYDAGVHDAAAVDGSGAHDSGGNPDAKAGGDGGPAEAGSTDASGSDASSGDGGCAAGASQSCATTCGTTGSETCTAGTWGACAPPAETCNLQDDDCNGQCDDLLGCRIGVDRSFSAAQGWHFYTVSDAEASCCGYAVEGYDAFYLYDAAQPGLVPFYRCVTGAGAHFYSTDPACEGQTTEGSLGYIATSAVCGSVPLYRLANAAKGDHLYTTSMAEVTSAEAAGYVLESTVGYVWPGACGGTSCTWPSPVHMVGSSLVSATGFPSTWYGFPIAAGPQVVTSIKGTVAIAQSAAEFSETLFILQYLPSGTCTAGMWPSSTPEYGPPGAQPLAQFIVKDPTASTVSVPIDLTLPGGVPVSSCLLLGVNGGPVSAVHPVTSAADLVVSYAPAQPPTQSLLVPAGEFCFGQTWGCQAATTNDAQSFATVTPVTSAGHLVALYGDISDSTFDGTGSFGAPPAGAWTATNDFYVYHGSECGAFGVSSGPAGPGSYLSSIPNDAVHLASVPMTGSGIGVGQHQVLQTFSGQALAAGDCIVALWGLQGGGGFDNETQVFALVGP